jgi:integrase
MAREALTDRKLKSLKADPRRRHYDRWDAVQPGLGVRVSDKGRKTFVLMARIGRGGNPRRLAIGEYGAVTLADARAIAHEWLKQAKAGKHPGELRARQQENTFASAAEKFIAHIHRQKLRTAAVMEHRLRETFIKESKWGPRPITEIGPDDVKRVIRKAVERDATYQAFHNFALIRRLFNWALGTDDYGLESNPCDRLNSADLIGHREARQRVLTDDELRAFWRATQRLGYPYGPFYRLLALTGLRLGEVCGAHWSEIDLSKKAIDGKPAPEWTIPAARMKKVRGGAKPFVVPLTDAMLGVLSALPRFKSGDYLFSNSHGQQPLRPNLFSDPKKRLNAIMLEELRKIAGDRTLPDFVNHDIRRTVRTHLSALRIGEEVREAVLAHVRPGIKGVYDRHQYLDEKREALTLWNARLRSIVEPPPANVVALRGGQ